VTRYTCPPYESPAAFGRRTSASVQVAHRRGSPIGRLVVGTCAPNCALTLDYSRQTPSLMRRHRETCFGSQIVAAVEEMVVRYASTSIQRLAFQACLIGRSSISPYSESTTYSQSARCDFRDCDKSSKSDVVSPAAASISATSLFDRFQRFCRGGSHEAGVRCHCNTGTYAGTTHQSISHQGSIDDCQNVIARGTRRRESVLSNQHRLLGEDTRHRALR
jgi:hypothetical protein